MLFFFYKLVFFFYVDKCKKKSVITKVKVQSSRLSKEEQLKSISMAGQASHVDILISVL